MGRPEPLVLHDVAAGERGEPGLHERLDLAAAVVVGDEDVLAGTERRQAADDMLEHGLAGDVDQGLGLGVGVRAQAGPLAGDSYNFV